MNARPVSCPVLIGRERELTALGDARRALAQSRASVVLVSGEAGIGKSRLLGTFLRAAADGRARTIVSVECQEHASAPFGPIRDAVVELAQTTGATLDPLLARFAARETANESLEKGDLFSAIAAFIRERARERATILAIEDLHWADATTLEFLGFLPSRIAGTRLMVIATYRSDEAAADDALTATLARAMREPLTMRVDLAALEEAELRKLLGGALDGHPPLAARTLGEIAVRAEGNPFFAEELLKDALERRIAPAAGDLPISIRASIVSRLRALTPDERRVVDRAAVLGLRFDPHVLARTMGTDVDALLPALRRARDANLIVEEDAPRVRFRFRHALTRQAVYDDLLLFDARRTHRTILETLESFGADDDYLEELAYHAWEARDAAKALRYNERAAEAAFSLFAFREARDGFARALEAATERADRARLLQRLGRVTSLLGDVERAKEIFDEAIPAAVELGAYDAAAVMASWGTADRNNSGDLGAFDYGSAFLERYGDRVSRGPRDDLLTMLARVALVIYDVDRATPALARVEAPEELAPNVRQNYLIVRSELAWIAGDVAAWAADAERIIDLFPVQNAFSGLTGAYTLLQAATFAGRDDIGARALAMADRIEARAEFGALRSYGAAIRTADHYARGRLDLARDAIRAARAFPDLYVSTAAFAIVAPHVAAALDDDGLVSPDVEREIADVRVRARHADDAAILAGGAIMMVRRNRLGEARADLRAALACLPRAMPNSEAVLALAARHFTSEELPLLARFLGPDALEHPDANLRAMAEAAAGVLARRAGNGSEAERLGALAAERYHLIGRPLLATRALEIAGRTAEARDRYARCGAVGEIKRLDAALPAASRAGRDLLSEREREVAHWVAAGLANAAIAERLSITKKTVEKHVASIYDKLGVRTRAQLAVLLARSGGAEVPSQTA